MRAFCIFLILFGLKLQVMLHLFAHQRHPMESIVIILTNESAKAVPADQKQMLEMLKGFN